MKYTLLLLTICCSFFINSLNVCGTYDVTQGCSCNTGCVCSVSDGTCIYVPASVNPVAAVQGYCSSS